MCWLLVRAFSDPQTDSWQLGDIVEVRPEECEFGALETLPRYYRVHVPDLDAADIKELLEQPETQKEIQADQQVRDVVVHVRRWRMEMEKVTKGDPADQLTMTRGQARSFIKHVTDKSSPGF